MITRPKKRYEERLSLISIPMIMNTYPWSKGKLMSFCYISPLLQLDSYMALQVCMKKHRIRKVYVTSFTIFHFKLFGEINPSQNHYYLPVYNVKKIRSVIIKMIFSLNIRIKILIGKTCTT